MPRPMLSVPGGPNAVKTLMGWNQAVEVQDVVNPPSGFSMSAGSILRVSNYEIGTKQTANAPDYVTGRTDRTAYTLGPVEIDGSFDYPLTIEAGTAGAIVSGFEFFKAGALLAQYPTFSFSITGGKGEIVGGCKTAQCKMSCNQGEGINCSSTLWGISESTANRSKADSNHPNGDEGVQYYDESEATEDQLTNTFGPVTQTYGEVEGVDVSGKFVITQIPMWDAVLIEGAPTDMLVTGWEINIDNKLQRNYTMGNQSGASPWGLNATSITTGQRAVSGSVTWQSDTEGSLKAILGSGMIQLRISIQGVGVITLTNCVWNAAPPRISAGDRVTCQSQFTALGLAGTFDAITFGDPPSW